MNEAITHELELNVLRLKPDWFKNAYSIGGRGNFGTLFENRCGTDNRFVYH